MNKKSKGNFLIALGILMILGALGLTGYNLWDAERAGKEADRITDQMIVEISESLEDDKTAAPSQNRRHETDW